MIRRIRLAPILLALGLISGAAQAALIDRGGGFIYDTDLNVTWLKDANYAKTSAYDADGKMTWADATTWAANLVYHDSVRNVDYSDWRLPTTTDIGAPGCNFAYSGTDCGYNANPASSEMAHLFFAELGNKSLYDAGGNVQSGYGLVNAGLFTNFQSDSYWSGTMYPQIPGYAWFFQTFEGRQGVDDQSNSLYGLAVRPGDVGVVPPPVVVPLPAAAWLLGSGLLGLIGVARRGNLRV